MGIKLKNDESTPTAEILKQMAEVRPLPMGMQDFEDWSDRIISGALVPGATVESQKECLAKLLMHSLGVTESHKADAYYIHALRVAAVKEVAFAFLQDLNDKRKAKAEAEKVTSAT